MANSLKKNTGTVLKPLHFAMNLADLNQRCCPDALDKQIRGSSVKTITSTLSKLYTKAEQSYKEGDEETAYMTYMRYISAIQILKTKPEYMKNKQYYDTLIGKGNVNFAMDRCGVLSDNLKRRYDQRDEIERLDLEMKRVELTEAAAEAEKRQALLKTGGRNGLIAPLNSLKPKEQEKPTGPTKGIITVAQLMNYLEQKSTPLLVLDCRFASDYARSHLDHPNCISVPKEKLCPGSTAQKIYNELERIPDNSRACSLWKRRAEFPWIVLYDWNSSFENRDASEAISILYDALTKWDPTTKYQGEICILKGGIRHMYYSYPQFLNNPVEVQEDVSSKRIDPSQALQSVSYPNWDEDVPQIKPKESSPAPTPRLPPLQPQPQPSVPNPTKESSPAPADPRLPLTNSSVPILNNKVKGSSPSPVPEPRFPLTHQSSSLPNKVHQNGLDNGNFSNGRIDTVEIDRSTKPVRKYPVKPVINDTSSSSVVNGLPKVNGFVSSEESLDEDKSEERVETPKPEQVSKGSEKIIPPEVEAKNEINGKNESAPIPIPVNITRLRDDDTPRNSLLKRSHSNPNFAQSLPDEPQPHTPDFNRSQKPQRREFDMIYSSEGRSQSDGNRTGLKNLGNTCYMNSIMQCLNHTNHLANYFIKYRERTGRTGRTKDAFTAEVAAAIFEMNQGHRSIALNDLKAAILKRRPNFRPSEQQDSHEFLTLLLQSVHEELVDKRLGERDKLPNLDRIPEEESAELVWNHFMRTEKTIISELFAGQYRSSVTCSSCNHSSVTFETFFILTVPMPNTERKCTINECIDLSSAAEEVSGFKCTHCKGIGRAQKKLDIWRLPRYLIIHLQRFYNNGYLKKRLAEVEFPLDRLEVPSKLKGGRLGENGRSQVSQFQLYGVSNHYGSMDTGHYTAYCRRTCWAKYDDQDVTTIPPQLVGTPAAYILFYKNREWN